MATSIILRSAQRLVKSSLLKSVSVKQNCKTRHSSQRKLNKDIKIAVVGAGELNPKLKPISRKSKYHNYEKMYPHLNKC